MVKAKDVVRFATHPWELRSVIQWLVYHDPVHTRDRASETQSVAICYYYLEHTSRSFSSVIQELHPELKLPIAIFYLILRGLDTIEDDMTIPLSKKAPLLTEFNEILNKDGWTFNGNGPNEKDRGLLVHFDNVIKEYKDTKPAYRDIINDITKRMGDGMAKYAGYAEQNKYVESLEDYDEYCFFVAGLVGEGLTRLFVEAKLGNPLLLERPWLHKSMGLFLQKTNIIRDIREDFDENKRWWPRAIWSKHVDKFEDLFLYKNKQKALNCSSEMVLNALQHTEECLFYLLGLQEQSVFNFCAIPQAMAIATLELCFQNYSVFSRNVKITKGQACQLMLKSTQDQKTLFNVFRQYANKILRKNNPRDPNFLKISMACARIEKFVLATFPEEDPKPVVEEDENGIVVSATDADKLQKAAWKEAKEDTFFMAASVGALLLFMSLAMFWLAYEMGAKFDGVFEQFDLITSSLRNTVRGSFHGEL